MGRRSSLRPRGSVPLTKQLPNKTLQPSSRAQRELELATVCSRGLRLKVEPLAALLKGRRERIRSALGSLRPRRIWPTNNGGDKWRLTDGPAITRRSRKRLSG